MKRSILAVAMLFAVSAGSTWALDPPCQTGSGAQGQQAGSRKGKKQGPQDGSGPIHQPGTGGGTGAGRRAGRR
jgi:hypothetical protein